MSVITQPYKTFSLSLSLSLKTHIELSTNLETVTIINHNYSSNNKKKITTTIKQEPWPKSASIITDPFSLYYTPPLDPLKLEPKEKLSCRRLTHYGLCLWIFFNHFLGYMRMSVSLIKWWYWCLYDMNLDE